MEHPKIKVDANGDLWLNFGEYGDDVDVAAISGDGRRVPVSGRIEAARIVDGHAVLVGRDGRVSRAPLPWDAA